MHLSLYDATSERFARLERGQVRADTDDLLLIGPHATHPPAGSGVLRCPSDMVWLIGRIDALPSAVARLPPTFWPVLEAISPEDRPVRRPAAVDLWRGPPLDVLDAIGTHREHARTIAADFFANLCQGLAHAPRQPEDKPLLDRMHDAGLAPCSSDFGSWPAARQRALAAGLADAALLLRQWRRERPCSMHLPDLPDLLFTRRHALRAAAASRGIGTSDGEPLQGGSPDGLRLPSAPAHAWADPPRRSSTG